MFNFITCLNVKSDTVLKKIFDIYLKKKKIIIEQLEKNENVRLTYSEHFSTIHLP